MANNRLMPGLIKWNRDFLLTKTAKDDRFDH